MSTNRQPFINEEFRTKKLSKDERADLIEVLEILTNLHNNFTRGCVPKIIETEILEISKRIREGI